MRKKRVILSAGGTGGHLFPAQAVADRLEGECELLFVGGGLGKNRFFNQKKYPFHEITTSSIPKNPVKLIRSSWRICRGVFQSLSLLKKWQPDVVVGFGSFFTFPLLVAAKLKKIPIILHEQNSLPGKVNRLFAKHAKVTAITFPETAKLVKGKSIRVNFPLRWKAGEAEKKAALKYFGLEEGKLTLLIFGGSQGGAGLNKLFMESIPDLSSEIQVLHFTGNSQVKERAEELYKSLKVSFCVKEFETRMDLAWKIADLAFTRAGASTIAELIAWEVPAILIPFPHATDSHQEKNGKHFTECVKGGEMFLEGKTSGKELGKVIQKYISGEILLKKEEIKKYKTTNVCIDLHELILGD